MANFPVYRLSRKEEIFGLVLRQQDLNDAAEYIRQRFINFFKRDYRACDMIDVQDSLTKNFRHGCGCGCSFTEYAYAHLDLSRCGVDYGCKDELLLTVHMWTLEAESIRPFDWHRFETEGKM